MIPELRVQTIHEYPSPKEEAEGSELAGRVQVATDEDFILPPSFQQRLIELTAPITARLEAFLDELRRVDGLELEEPVRRDMSEEDVAYALELIAPAVNFLNELNQSGASENNEPLR